MRALGTDHGFDVEVSEDPGEFASGNLDRFRAVVFLSNVGSELDGAQVNGLRAFVRGGGGFLGIHDAARAQSSSDWFGTLVGARPAASPFKIQAATVDVLDQQHPATRDLPLTFEHSDRWINWDPNPIGTVHTVAQVRRRRTTRAPAATARSTRSPGARTTTAADRSTPAWAHRGQLGRRRVPQPPAGAIKWTTGMVRGDCQATIASNYTVERLTATNQPGSSTRSASRTA